MAGEAARAVFSAVVRTGSALVTDLAASLDGDATSRKGRQEKVSGWLARYDFASPVRDHLWKEGVALVGRDTVVAVDSGDISKEFGGAGMEGMEMGYDASRGVVAMGHSLLCAAVVARRRAAPPRLALLKGRRGLPDASAREQREAAALAANAYFCRWSVEVLFQDVKQCFSIIVEGFRTFVANVRELLRMERTRFISGRPRKRKPPDLTALLPGFSA